MKYLFFDGDNVGITIERFLMSGDLESAKKLSNGINHSILLITEYLKSLHNVEIILIGGDDILIKVNLVSEEGEIVNKITDIFKKNTELTMSCGIGNDIKESIFNLHIAKLFGKNQTKR